MYWRCFFGACFLTAAMLVPHAPAVPVVTGMLVAGLIQLAWFRLNRRKPRS